MISVEELSQLIAVLYAAPLEPEKWQVFFDQLSCHLRVSTGILIPISNGYEPAVVAGGGLAFNPEVPKIYNNFYVDIDPLRAPVFQNPRVAVVRGEELVSQDRLRKTEFYNDLVSKHEMEWMTQLALVNPDVEGAVMTLWRRKQDGPMDEACISLLEMLLPHAHTAIKIRARLQAAKVQEHFHELALESLAIAAILVSAAGKVIHMNRPAAAIVQRADGLRLHGSTLAALSLKDSGCLSSLIAEAAAARRNGTRTASTAAPGGALTLNRYGSGPTLYVSVLPAPEHIRAITGVPCALVFVSEPDRKPKSRATLLRSLFSLTPTEARLADLLLQGHSVKRAAEIMTITLETCRLQVKRILAKTDTHSQTELARLMLSLPGQSES
jgi:DNA-binding CsgD family transcriptional regulator